jgi:hypothetical protein
MTTLKRGALLLPALLVSAVVLAGCISIEIDGESIGGHGEDGSGVLVTEDRTVTSFSKVRISGALRVELDRGPLLVEVEFDDNLLEKLETTVRGSEIQIRCPDCSPTSGAVVRLTAPEIDAVEVSGASRLIVSNVDAEALSISISGASKIEIDGEVGQLEIDGSGASAVEAPNLRTDRLDLDMSGASRAEVAVIERVDGDLSGASRLTLTGNDDPTINVDTSGGSSVNRQ